MTIRFFRWCSLTVFCLTLTAGALAQQADVIAKPLLDIRGGTAIAGLQGDCGSACSALALATTSGTAAASVIARPDAGPLALAVGSPGSVWGAADGLQYARWLHTATLLENGKVLVAGGIGDGAPATGYFLASTELYDPATNTWAAGGSLSTPRIGHAATLLSDGKVLVMGGYSTSEILDGKRVFNYLVNAELYDPATNTWVPAGTLGTPRYSSTATLLVNGKVLVIGSVVAGADTTAELYDPASNSWTAAGTLLVRRNGHAATLLVNGKVLVTGGESSGVFASTEWYDPVTNAWRAGGALLAPHYAHTATLLANGKVLVAGGVASGQNAAGTELYDPATNTSAAGGSLVEPRRGHTATLLTNGKVLVAGGDNDYAGVELYDPATNAWKAASPLATGRRSPTTTLLQDGRVLLAGGSIDVSGGFISILKPLANAELFFGAPPVIEFYNSNVDHYFFTADAREAAAIEGGSAGAGWSRTGNSFKSGGTLSACRFYGSMSPGPNSHFYTVDVDECKVLKQLQARTPATQQRWNFESLDFFSTPPANGACPSGTMPVYRAYNNGVTRGIDSNHRLSSSAAAIQEVVSRGWVGEGVVMCAPI